jgi:hypothetical protein
MDIDGWRRKGRSDRAGTVDSVRVALGTVVWLGTLPSLRRAQPRSGASCQCSHIELNDFTMQAAINWYSQLKGAGVFGRMMRHLLSTS